MLIWMLSVFTELTRNFLYWIWSDVPLKNGRNNKQKEYIYHVKKILSDLLQIDGFFQKNHPKQPSPNLYFHFKFHPPPLEQ